MRLMLILLLFNFAGSALAEDSTCQAIAKIPDGWISTLQNGVTVFLSPDKSASLSIECSILPRVLNDTEFAAHIGEEEPEESPALQKFGEFRGRIWMMENHDMAWWLKKERFMVHLSLNSHNKVVSNKIESQVNDIATSLVIKQP